MIAELPCWAGKLGCSGWRIVHRAWHVLGAGGRARASSNVGLLLGSCCAGGAVPQWPAACVGCPTVRGRGAVCSWPRCFQAHCQSSMQLLVLCLWPRCVQANRPSLMLPAVLVLRERHASCTALGRGCTAADVQGQGAIAAPTARCWRRLPREECAVVQCMPCRRALPGGYDRRQPPG